MSAAAPSLLLLAVCALALDAPAELHPIDALLETLARGDAEGPLRVGEPELNDWLASSGVLPPGVEDLQVSLAPGGLSLRGRVDAARYADQLPPSAAAAVAFMEGPLAVELVARLESGAGQGRLSVDSLRLGGLPFPTAFVPTIVAAFTRSAERPYGFDVTQPFPLPAGIERVRLGRGEAWLDLRPRSPR